MSIFTLKDNLAVAAIILFGIWLLPGCAATRQGCNQWPDIQKESRYADFYCLHPHKDGSRCTRAEEHYGQHHAHSLDGYCLRWR